MNFRTWLEADQPTGIGYRVMGLDGERAFSLYNPSITVPTTVGATYSRVYLGTTKKFTIDNSGSTVGQETILMTFKYNLEDLVQGCPEEEGQILVDEAILMKVEPCTESPQPVAEIPKARRKKY